MGFIAWIIIGGIAGWIASKIKGKDADMGVFANIGVGVVGGLLGGWILGLFGVDVAGGGFWFSLFTCTLGAVIFLSILQAIKK
ncbi:MAG: GlsB/YeaQ/YmgE family stress response membrane protein [Corynebacterium sp.]|nr:GlsB/YeaQ/YmgE family stress response membrane protein [Corynebacterium sp.]